MVEVEDLHADQTNKSVYHNGSWGRGLGSRKANLTPTHPALSTPFVTDRSKAKVLLFVNCSAVLHSQINVFLSI